MSIIRFSSRAAGLFLLSIMVAGGAFAQNSRPTPKPSPEVPEIISRAGEYQPVDQVIYPQNQTYPDNQSQSLEKKIDDAGGRIKELGKRVNTLESTKENEYDRKQRRLLLNLDILSRAEQRTESLRKQLFDLIEKEAEIKTKLELLENDLRPETIDRMIAFAGTMRPEELRRARKQNLETEKTNLQDLLTQITSNKNDLQFNVQKADILVDKLRSKLEKEIDEALTDDEDN